MTDHWILTYDDYIHEQQGLREALCVLGNGYFATRGAFPEAEADGIHYPATYLAGGYNRLETEIAGRVIENEDLVNIPNWTCLDFRINDGEWFNIKAVELIQFKQELNLKKGILSRTLQFKDAQGHKTTLITNRYVHIKKYHLAVQEQTIIAENWSGKIDIRTSIDGQITNSGVTRYQDLNNQHMHHIDSGIFDDQCMYLKVETNQSEVRIAEAAYTHVTVNNQPIDVKPKNTATDFFVSQEYSLEVKEKDKIAIDKVVAIYTSKDKGISECLHEAKKAVQRESELDKLYNHHIEMWDTYWDQFDINMEVLTDDAKMHPLLILRVHIFHLLQTACLNTIDLDVGVPARGWHGEAYRGHIFWDELFIFPTLNLRMPRITVSLLKYRFQRMHEARYLAQNNGFHGTMFPWQSGSDGREESQVVHLNPVSGRWHSDNSSLQRHVNAAIAFNAWRYYETTGDMEFLYLYGAELILEITRFLTSLCTYNDKKKRYEILGVMGPDEYHDAYPDADKPGLNNNAYTNLMTVWVLSRALEILDILPQDYKKELIDTLELKKSEIELWKKITTKMFVPFHDDGIISQFEGYEKLKEFQWKEYTEKYKDIQRLDRILEAEGDTPNHYQLSKQADVLMLFYLFSTQEIQQLFEMLGYGFQPNQIPDNIDYYLHRTSHGSTLSRLVHSWVISRGHRAKSWELFLHALKSDVMDIQGGTTPEGIHLGAMAGTVDLVQRCYAGIEIHGEVLWFNPSLPDAIKSLKLHIHYRGHSLEVELNHNKLRIIARHTIAPTIHIGFENKIYNFSAGETKEFQLSHAKALT